MLTKTKAVFTHLPSEDEIAQAGVTFVVADSHSRIHRTLILDWTDYRDMGEPEQVTVTVEPGGWPVDDGTA